MFPPFITIDSHVSVEAARVYRFPVFERSFCEQLVEELEHFEQSSAPKGRPNSMNHYGTALANTASVEPRALAEEADRFFLAARRFTSEVLAPTRSGALPGRGTPPSRGSGADDID
ncbi:2-oxoglutarate and iron-dependent oxygenase domain containing protein 2 [Dissostichus eleginoides]|uniref:2-oxoglutarate and iron-dependent oxygenase domain containing protein 2 n=1 Tax=Dissostichus eleginoides TaxID=100907 RepID=A0AAD9F469_DISEL|nr:2-oxoglutarate and iron-dependent oxygenase domain containing protein 2 [Dissostichus eleginoides]